MNFEPIVVAPNLGMAKAWVADHPDRFMRRPVTASTPNSLRGVSDRVILVCGYGLDELPEQMRETLEVLRQYGCEVTFVPR